MKKIIYILGLIIFICLSINQAMAKVKDFMPLALGSWLGYPIDNVIDSWGLPSDEKTIAGKHYFIWRYIVTTQSPRIISSSLILGGTSINYYCTKIFLVDENNIIQKGQFEGNMCPGSYSSGKFLVNPDNNVFAKQQTSNKSKKVKNDNQH